MLSAICLNLGQSEILLSGNGLKNNKMEKIKSKAFAEHSINVALVMVFVLNGEENRRRSQCCLPALSPLPPYIKTGSVEKPLW